MTVSGRADRQADRQDGRHIALIVSFGGSASEINISVTLHKTKLRMDTKGVPDTVANYIQSRHAFKEYKWKGHK